MELEIKPIEEMHFADIFALYEDNNFYLKTKRPESLSEGIINKLLSENSGDAYTIWIEDRMDGIFICQKEKNDSAAMLLHLRMRNMEWLIQNANEFEKHIQPYIDDYNIIRMRIYDFDKDGKRLCEKLSFTKEVTMKNHVFKDNKYHDVITYVKEIKKIGGNLDD